MHRDIARSNIVLARPDGSDANVIASGTDPSWSRGAQLILFKTWDEQTQTLWVSIVSPTGTGVRRLGQGVHPSWPPDGSRIAYMHDRDDGGSDIWIMNRDGSNAACLTCNGSLR